MKYLEARMPALVFAGLLAGCAAGPDFVRPDVSAIATTDPGAMFPTQTVSTPVAHGGAQHLKRPTTVDMQWWRAFDSEKLTALIVAALANSPTIAAAQARLRQAEETLAARNGATAYPLVDANLNAQRQQANPAAQGLPGNTRTFDLYGGSIGIRYNFDLAGGNRRALEALAAQVDYQRFQWEGAQRALAANIASTAIVQARLAAQLKASEAILHGQQEQLDVALERVRLGEAAPDDVLALRTQLEQTRAGIPTLRNQHQHTGHLLAVLTGRAPGDSDLPSFTLEDFVLPAELPVVVSSELVRRRPDIRASEALLHAANAEYGVAVANLYPQLNLSASLGSQALSSAALFGSGSLVWSLMGQITQPLFNPGLPAEKRRALAAFDAAAANYHSVVLESLRQVADILRSVENDAQVLAAQAAAGRSAQESLTSMQHKYRLGAASYLQLLITQQQAQQAEFGLIAAQAQRLSDSVALFDAMGGPSGDSEHVRETVHLAGTEMR
ncbi:MAG TPA: efflux transporter outer membrane subunit [Noviherbaspirillum sp.]|uniref:efflux transporter outer membrane subunit n=1 Tax=Noviherbaspirillum sp. TaxID=1926288 RepID=UPI002B473368|nr:efflux transporter outer membrane subunit [Noviherbaspirillum sp.]HJV84094.1 efflux transporter outer membrane subunit [Noviherbaspirillum sp.]